VETAEMASTIQVPDFSYPAGGFYPELLEALLTWLRDNVPEISTENPADPAIQLLRAFALVGHYNNVNLDIVAHETLMPTAQLRDSVVDHMALIGYAVAGDRPATSTVVLELTKTFATASTIAQDNSLFSTKRTSDLEPVLFESDAAVDVTATDVMGAVYVWDESLATFTDETTDANTATNYWDGLPPTPAAGDILYLGHADVMTNSLKWTDIQTAMAGVIGVWEVYKTSVDDAAPDSVATAGTQLKVVVDTLLGLTPNASRAGRLVTVEYNPTGASEELAILWDGANNYVNTTAFLGQTTPSTTASDYTVGSHWYEVPGLDDETADLTIDGDVNFTLPKTAVYEWDTVEINSFTGYFIRFYVISVSGPTAPNFDALAWDQGSLYTEVAVTQGRTRSDAALGTSDGSQSQAYTLGNGNVIEGTVAATVAALSWTEVDSFLNSNSIDQHYRTTIDSDGEATITFGDGTNGAIPPTSSAIAAVYRTDAHVDGNVGASAISRIRGGLAFVRRVFNPSPASGWVIRRGSTGPDLELVKLEGPADLRTMARAVAPEDAEFLATSWEAADGTIPVKRAKAVEGSYGAKTVTLYVIGPDGLVVSSAYRLEMETYFNGDDAIGTSGVMVANQRVYVRDATLVPITVTATVAGGNQASIEAALTGLLSPLALDPDGTTYTWAYGQDVPDGKVLAAIFNTDSGITAVTMSAPAAPTVVAADALPSAGTFTITVT
jgi:hypothetical protein